MKDLMQTAMYSTYQAQWKATLPYVAGIGLSPGQPKVLDYLSRCDSCMQKDIAEALDIEPATVSQLLVNMESDGLIERAKSPHRCRAEHISITDKGSAAYQRWRELCLNDEKTSLKGFTKEERSVFLSYLARMYQNLTGRPLE